MQAWLLQRHQILRVAELDELEGVSINQKPGNFYGVFFPIERSS